MLRCESLHHLDTPPVPMHVAETTRIHQNVKPKLLPRAEPSQHLVVPPAMPQTQVDDFPPPSFSRDLNRLPNLPVGMVTMLVDERGRDLHFQRLFVEQVHDRFWRRDRSQTHHSPRPLPQLTPRFHLIGI